MFRHVSRHALVLALLLITPICQAADVRAEAEAVNKESVQKNEPEPTGVFRQVSFVSIKNPKVNTVVLRSLNEVKAATAKSKELRAIAQAINLDQVDFMQHMVVVIQSGPTNAFGVRVTVDKLEIAEAGKSTIHWTYRPYFGGAAPPDEPGNPGVVAVVEKVKGEVDFKKTVWRWPEGEALPPSSPPPPGPPPQPGGAAPRLPQ